MMGVDMGIFSIFKKHNSNEITNEKLIPILTKNIIENLIQFWHHGEGTFFEIENSSNKDEKGNGIGGMYLVEDESAFIDDDGMVYGWLHIQEYSDIAKTYLLKISSTTLKYKFLFVFEFIVDDVAVNNPKFKDINLTEYKGAIKKSIQHLVNISKFNNYRNPPPYVFFAKMIN
jgi:hypothetical protein